MNEISNKDLHELAIDSLRQTRHLINQGKKNTGNVVNEKYKKINTLAKNLIVQIKSLSSFERSQLGVGFCTLSGLTIIHPTNLLVEMDGKNTLELLESAYCAQSEIEMIKALTFFTEYPQGENFKFPQGTYRPFLYDFCYRILTNYPFLFERNIKGLILDVAAQVILENILSDNSKGGNFDGVGKADVKRGLENYFDEIFLVANDHANKDSQKF